MPSTQICRISQIAKLSDDIWRFEFESLEADAHIDVYLENDMILTILNLGRVGGQTDSVKREGNGAVHWRCIS